MQLPGPVSLGFLLFVLVLLPWGARRTAHRLRDDATGPPIGRVQYWRSAVLLQVVLLVFAWITGAGFGYRIFAIDGIGWGDMLLSVTALAACLGLRFISRWARSEEELRRLTVYYRAPRTKVELAWFTIAVLIASVAEEAAYRGVGWTILWYSLGDPWVAAVIMCGAFALAHWNQGWKSGVPIFGMAAVLHALVALTGTLIFAMGVHAIFDFVAGRQIRQRARMYDQSADTVV